MSECKACGEFDGNHLIGCTVRLEHLKHEGNYRKKIETCPYERAFAETWEKWNVPSVGINHGFTTLELVVLKETGRVLGMPILEDELTQRDCYVAASVIQWLGTAIGESFLNEVKEKIKKDKG